MSKWIDFSIDERKACFSDRRYMKRAKSCTTSPTRDLFMVWCKQVCSFHYGST